MSKAIADALADGQQVASADGDGVPVTLAQIVAASFFIPFILPLLMRSGRALAIGAAIPLVLILAGVQAAVHEIDAPNNHGSPGDAIVPSFLGSPASGL